MIDIVQTHNTFYDIRYHHQTNDSFMMIDIIIKQITLL